MKKYMFTLVAIVYVFVSMIHFSGCSSPNKTIIKGDSVSVKDTVVTDKI
jgi:S-formylglutathione hydrolase FrmB